MARVKNASFVGATPFDVDVDALTLGRVLQNAVGDTALVYDKLTGENAEALPVNHTGPGRGCVLGVPLWNQYIGRSINYVATGTAKGGIPGLIYLIAHPFYLPRGESSLTVRLVTEGGNLAALRPSVRVTSTTGVTRQAAAMEVEDGEAFARLSGMTEGLNLVFVEVNTQGSALTDLLLLSWHGYFDRIRQTGSAVRAPTGSTAVGVTTPSATQAVAFTDMDTSWFSSGAAFDGFLTSHLDRNLNGLAEFGSGWPAGGNVSYTHVDHDGAGLPDPTNPARSRFHAHTRTLLANEAEIDFPVWCEALGAMGTDGVAVAAVGATAPTVGMLQWFAPYPTTNALAPITRTLIRYPDFQSTSSRLKACILAGTNEPGNVTSWTGTITTSGSVGAVFGTPFDTQTSTGTPLSVATPTAIPFTGDGITLTSLQTSKGAALSGTYEEIFLLGVCLYFEGT